MRMRSAVAVVLLLAGGMMAHPSAVSAHPNADVPQELALVREGTVIHAVWTAVSDDRAALTHSLGLVPTSRTFVSQEGQLVATESDQTDDELLQSAPTQLGDYLLEHIQISQDLGACTGELVKADAVATEGARLTFTCPGSTGPYTVTSTSMNEIHELHQTVITAESVPLVHLTQSSPAAIIDFDAQGQPFLIEEPVLHSSTVPVLAALVAILIAFLAWHHRHPSATTPPPRPPTRTAHR